MKRDFYDTNLFPLNLSSPLCYSFTLIIYKKLGSFYKYLVICRIFTNFVEQKCVFGRIEAQPAAL